MTSNGLVAAVDPSWPVEPVLDVHDIQGIAVPGFLKPQQTLLYVRFPRAGADVAASIAAIRQFLAQATISSAEETLDDRRAHRSGRSTENNVLCAVGLTFQGLRALVPEAAHMTSAAYRLGLGTRSAMLGDPQGPHEPGDPANWVVGGSGKELDALFVFAGTKRARVNAAAADASHSLAKAGALVETEEGGVRPDLVGHEHFGFDDGVSQPGIRGRSSARTDDFVTDRHVDPTVSPFEARLSGYPGQALVWPGELVIGYPSNGPDPLLPGAVSTAGPDWTRNGSFLVFRRLQQDVAAFWNWIADTRKANSDLNGISDDVALAARLVGRWPSGAPFNRTPGGENETLGENSFENNNFLFDGDTPDIAFIDGNGVSRRTQFPTLMAKSDPAGITCPWAAHIRKVNTRDSGSDMGATLASYKRRLLRVGIPYGPPIVDNYKDDGVDRGLLFLSIQASIEDQFEFLQARWMNDSMRPKAPGGNDMLVGQNAAAADGVRSCVLFPPNTLAITTVKATKQWVIPRGGGYFFLPSITALRTVVGSA
ncbi:Dyp-type peroxidase [soil metagenome]